MMVRKVMLKISFVVFTIMVANAMAYRKNSGISPMVQSNNYEPRYKFQMNQQKFETNKRLNTYRAPTTMYYNWYRMNENGYERTPYTRRKQYQNNRKQDFGVGNRIRKRVRSTTPISRPKYRPLLIVN